MAVDVCPCVCICVSVCAFQLNNHKKDIIPATLLLLLQFLNKNAYIEIAVYGKNFCASAKNAFFLLMRNILRVAVLDKVTDFLLFIGKFLVQSSMKGSGLMVTPQKIIKNNNNEKMNNNNEKINE